MPLYPANAPWTCNTKSVNQYRVKNGCSFEKGMLYSKSYIPNNHKLKKRKNQNTVMKYILELVSSKYQINFWDWDYKADKVAMRTNSKSEIIYVQEAEDREGEELTAFCPSTVQKIPSEAFARHARIIYVGSIYFTSARTPISLKYFLVWNKTVVRTNHLDFKN